MKRRLYHQLIHFSFILLAVLTIAMAAATFVEHAHGTPFAFRYIYHSPWFMALWMVLIVVGGVVVLRRRRPWPVVLLHVALVVILIGATLSYFTAESGRMNLRQGIETDAYWSDRGPAQAARVAHLPFRIKLENFRVVWHEGGSVPKGYVARLAIYENGWEVVRGTLGMNEVLTHRGVRFYLMGFDSDYRNITVVLRVDRWGMAVSYTGYVLLLLAFGGLLLSPRGTFRRLLRSPLLRRGAAAGVLVLFFSLPNGLQAAPVLPVDVAADFGRLFVVHNGRVCPVQTLAVDVTAKLSGVARYAGLTPEQVLTGCLFWPEEWQDEPLLKIRSAALRCELGVEGRGAYRDFFHDGYRLAPLLERYCVGERQGLPAAAAEVDDCLALMADLREGRLLRMFPLADGTLCRWHAFTDSLPADLLARAGGVQPRTVLQELRAAARSGNYTGLCRQIQALADFQQRHGASDLPPASRVAAERMYNAFNPLPWLVGYNLAAALVLFVLLAVCSKEVVRRPGQSLLAFSLAMLTAHLALRSFIGARLPLSNAYETMLTVAWVAQVAALLVSRLRGLSVATGLVVPFGLIISGAFLLVALLGRMNPQITPLMPVLSSPWMSLHVSLVMAAYALLSFTFLCAVAALLTRGVRRWRDTAAHCRHEDNLQLLSRLLLLPALALLAAGIFVGAVWAGESWGRYWGWDPKETWALITLLVYALPLHDGLLRRFRSSLAYHLYMLLAFGTVLMTYFGVNYYLTGLHSYAG